MRTWSHLRHILCVRLDNMGDVLMTTPAMRALRNLNERVRITLLASSSGVALAPHLREVDDVIRYSAPWIKHGGDGEAHDRRMIDRLAARGYDAAVIFTTYSQSALPAALMCHLAGIPRRLAYCRENPYLLLTDWIEETDRDDRNGTVPQVRHEVRRHLDLVARVGASVSDERLSFHVGQRDRVGLRRKLALHGLRRHDNLLVVHAGATAPSRRWPANKFSAAATQLRRDLGCDIVFTGSAEEKALCESLRGAVGEGSHVLAGDLTLGELGALIETARVLLSNNSGPVHIAAAVGTPVVDLYALTNPQHTPWRVPHRVLSYDVPCRNCYKSVCPQGHHDCLARVEAEEAVAAVTALWQSCGAAEYNETMPLSVAASS